MLLHADTGCRLGRAGSEGRRTGLQWWSLAVPVSGMKPESCSEDRERASLAAVTSPRYDACREEEDEVPAVCRAAMAAEEAEGVHQPGTMTQLDATLFIVGELAGAGLLALSEALSNTGEVLSQHR